MSNHIILGVTLLYVAGMIGIGLYYRGRADDQSGFLVAGRSIGATVGGGALAVTYMSTASLLGVVSNSYMVGVGWMIFAGVGVTLGFLVAMLYVGPKLRDVRSETLPEYFGTAFGHRSRTLSSAIIVVVMVVYLVAQVRGGALVAESVLGFSYTESVLLITAAFVLYTFFGGMYAITVTSFLQAVILIVGVALVAFFGLSNAGGWSVFLNDVSQNAGHYFTPGGRIGIGFGLSFGAMVFLGVLASPHVIFRFFASKDEVVARHSSAVAALFTAVFYSIILIPPALAILLVPGLDNPDAAYIALVRDVFSQNPIVVGLILASILSAAMSSADAMLMNATSSLVYDLGEHVIDIENSDRVTLYLRIVTIGVGAIAALITIAEPGLILTVMIAGMSLFVGAFTAPVLLSASMDHITDWTAASAMVCGFAAVVLSHPMTPGLQLAHDPAAGVFGALVSTVVFFVAHYATSTRTEEGTPA